MLGLVPNVLSVLRLLLACFFWALPEAWRLAAVVAGGASDWLDGFIARRYHLTSAAGQILDALADKLLILSVLVTLTVAGDILWWQAVLVVVRDLVVGGLALYALAIRRRDAFAHMRPKLAGKVTTAALFSWFVALLVPLPPPVNWTLFAAAAGTSVLAGLDYYIAFLRRPPELRGRGPAAAVERS